MSSIAAIDRRCFVPPPQQAAAPREPQQFRVANEGPSYLLTWRPPLERVKARA